MKLYKPTKGTNQFKKRYKNHMWETFYIGFLLISLMVAGYKLTELAHMAIIKDAVEKAYAEMPITSPLPEETPKVKEEVKKTPLQEEIEGYIKTIFRGDSRVAIAVSHNECSPKHRLYPYCDQTITDKEYSVGVFQINLLSKAGKVHYDRVPGDTLEEKVAWLREPKNNVLVAYWIFQTSGWNPWSAYKNGNYLKDM